VRTLFLAIAMCFVLLACSESAHYGDDDDDDDGTGGTAGASETGDAAGTATAGSNSTGGVPIPVGGTGGTSDTGGIGARGPYPQPDTDGDGISDQNEIPAGSNPLAPDSDGDGCDDLVESLFGEECDSDTMVSVHSCQGETSLVLTMATGTGSRMSDLTTEIAPLGSGFAEDLWAQATEVTPADAGEVGDLFALVSVEPEAVVSYRVIPNVVFKWEGVRTYALRISSEEGGELASGRIAWHRRDCGPYIE
jgi:hypothetical protein